jgi:UDP-N-acetylglucosamine--N-acetylmuramyl-(pentapeptide) pyrophosphoryl-undecaprenol N-acetylglucosamine transferase
MQSPKFIISGGGTGGHIFPAIAIADTLKAKVPECEILFVGAQGRMEMEKVPQAGYKIEGLWISGLQRRLTAKNLSFPFKVISSLLKSRKIIKKFNPDIAIGVGGYASGPLLRMAAGGNVKTLIQEQNSFPGITNKLLAGKVDKICVAYEGMERWFPKSKIVITGNPVRQKVVDLKGKGGKAVQHFGFDNSKPIVLAIGGSLGARSINHGIENSLTDLADAGVQVLWQTGKLFIEQAEKSVKEAGLEKLVKPMAFITEMDLAYAAAEVIVSRAGAISISELSLVGKPVILVPSPHVAEDHQTKNANALVDTDAAEMVKDSDAPQKLGAEILKIAGNSDRKKLLSENILKHGKANAADRIADEVLKLIEK